MLLFCDSFDHYTSLGAKYNTYGISGASIVGAGNQYTGTQCLQINGGAGPYINVASKTRVLVGTRFNSCGVGGIPILYLEGTVGSSDINCILQLGTDGSVYVYKTWTSGAYNSTYATSAPGVANLGAYNYYEVKFFGDPTAGSIQVRVNGVLVINVANANTVAGSSTAAIGGIGLRGRGSSFNSYHDDVYVLDWSTAPLTDFIGPVQVFCCLPTSDSSPLQWTPSVAGPHYPLVAAVPPNTVQWVNSATPGQIDQYLHTFAGIPGNAVIFAIQHGMNVALDAAGTASLASCVGGVAATVAALSSTSYGYVLTPYAANPVNGAGWVYSALAATGFGPKITATSGPNVRVTQSVVELLGGALCPTFQAMVLG